MLKADDGDGADMTDAITNATMILLRGTGMIESQLHTSNVPRWEL
jgi:hypothetical protein